MLHIYDYIVIGFYFLFICSLGLIFKRFNISEKDYFTGGQKMTWWLVGSSAFISNFSCWTFTGAASIAYDFGTVIFFFYLNDAFCFLITTRWFAKRFRQMRVITAMDAVRNRFGFYHEQFYTWLSVLAQFIVSGVGLVGLSVILSSVFHLPQVPMIIGTGIAVIAMALLGGSWAVFAGDFIQLLLLASVTVLTAVLTLFAIGGPIQFIHQIPLEHLNPIIPLGGKYDWFWVISAIVSGVYAKNSLLYASKFIVAKDGREAQKGAWIPTIGYFLFPVLWFIPPLAAQTLVPDLLTRFSSFTTPSEASYIAVCLVVLPPGMLGLMITGLFAATMASMDVSLNKNAGFLVNNFYRPVLRPNSSQKELLVAGKIATLLGGSVVVFISVLLATNGQIRLFDMYLYVAGFITIPMGTPIFLGIIFDRTPKWSVPCTVFIGAIISALCFLFVPWLSTHCFPRNAFISYLSSHAFTVCNLFNTAVTSAIFLASRRFYVPANEPQDAAMKQFFANMDREVDFEKEVGRDNSAEQALLLGSLSLIYGGFLLLIALLPNSWTGNLCLGGCALFMLAIGGLLFVYRSQLGAPKSSYAIPLSVQPIK